MRTVFVNPERCIGCLQCVYACAVEHSLARAELPALSQDPPPRSRIHVEAGPKAGTSYPNRCRHCDPAPCIAVCPTAAISRDAEHDVVLIDESKCIACAMCAIVCPFDVITYHPVAVAAHGHGTWAGAWGADGQAARTVAVKCDGCITRLREGREPACVEVCKVDALTFGEVNEVVRDARRRESIAVLATGDPREPARSAIPETVRRWRALGAEAASVGTATPSQGMEAAASVGPTGGMR
jgi:carbon-monoxide dehydrogenase iron sulfur subunit